MAEWHEACPVDIRVLERGWLSSNNIVVLGDDEAAVIDTGYASHAEQTERLVALTIGTRHLTTILNTHSHSDHVGGNARLQQRFGSEIWIPCGIWDAVADWNETALSYGPTGQRAEQFVATHAVSPGDTVTLAGRRFEAMAAPGHDPHSLVLFDAVDGILISADALWQNGFGVVFPELEGVDAFDEVEQVLDMLSSLPVQWVIPGHGAPFSDVVGSIDRARSKLALHRREPGRHASHAAKVLIKFRMMEWSHRTRSELLFWARSVPLLISIWRHHFSDARLESWLDDLLYDLVRSGALAEADGQIFDRRR